MRHEQIGMHQLFLPFLYQVINGWSSFLFLESKGVLWAGWQPHLSVYELLIACCHLWLVWFKRGTPSILATALSLQIDSQKRGKKKIPLALETPVTEPLFSQPGPAPVLWTKSSAPESHPEQMLLLETSPKAMKKLSSFCYPLKLLEKETIS